MYVYAWLGSRGGAKSAQRGFDSAALLPISELVYAAVVWGSNLLWRVMTEREKKRNIATVQGLYSVLGYGRQHTASHGTCRERLRI